MKLNLFFTGVFILLACTTVHAQAQLGRIPLHASGLVYFADINGKITPASQGSDIGGTPLLSEEWNTGTVKFSNGRIAGNVPLKFNIEYNILTFLRDSVAYEFVDNVQEFSFSIEKNKQATTVTYRNGYPAAGKLNPATFYEVVAEGPRVQLLSHTLKRITETFVMNSPPKRQYVNVPSYYLFDSATQRIQKIKLKKSSITDALPGLEKRIEELCGKDNWDLKSEEELRLLVQAL